MDNEEPLCPACKSRNDADAVYCDQCGQPLAAPKPEGGDEDGGCPACGGAVESGGDGKGVCADCGLELVETPAEHTAPAVDAGAVERLTAAILRRTGAGLPVDQAVAEGCREVLGTPAADAGSAAPGEPVPCPLCGELNADEATRCVGCGIWYGVPRTPQPCPRCERPTAAAKCQCGAILTLPKLLEFIEPSVRFICARCRAPYAVSRPNCADCGGALLSADRIKTFAELTGN
ncbi:MAG: zinc ribbon domain-containing protein [Elusimicrobia bacterium]|nr:zinc ribbon domain-containing protein [Elusimicrobiota bacterium]